MKENFLWVDTCSGDEMCSNNDRGIALSKLAMLYAKHAVGSMRQ